MSDPNGVIMQFFQWYTIADGTLWTELSSKAAVLRSAGFTSVWLPPAYKGAGGSFDVGYGSYDLFDLGEFNQKNTIRTKYGTKAELIQAIDDSHAAGLQVYEDVVFNHKDGADEKELVWAQPMNSEQRNQPIGPWQQFNAWTKFTYPGRQGRYSKMIWNWRCFDAISYNADTQNAATIYRLKDKHFSTQVSPEHGNYDYLFADDLDMSGNNGEFSVYGELMYWGEWILDQTKVDGFRIDACKHIRSSFFPAWLEHLRGKTGKELFSVGEYWSAKIADLHQFLYDTDSVMSLFDVPLHYKFSAASNSGNRFDMRTILDGTLMKERPGKAVTFVENHDTQPFQSLFSPVEPWFKPHAYALILLRAEGYPCVFYADYYGATYPNRDSSKPAVILYPHQFLIDCFLKARQNYGYGEQHDYFDHPNTIGWVRTGDALHPGAMAVVMTNGSAGSKRMNTFKPNATFTDATGHFGHTLTTNGDGWANFPCPAGNVSVWTQN